MKLKMKPVTALMTVFDISRPKIVMNLVPSSAGTLSGPILSVLWTGSYLKSLFLEGKTFFEEFSILTFCG